jgi:hypothetical protein
MQYPVGETFMIDVAQVKSLFVWLVADGWC